MFITYSFIVCLCFEIDNVVFLNIISENFGGHGVSGIDTSKGLLYRRPYSGVAVLWKREFCQMSKSTRMIITAWRPFRSGSLNASRLFRIYMPTNTHDVEHLPEYTACLANVSAVIDSCDAENVFVLNDFNAHPSARFGYELTEYYMEQKLRCIL